MSAPLRFPAPVPPEGQNERRLSPQQLLVSQVFALYDEFGAERPAPALAVAWTKRIFSGDGSRLLEHLAEIALKGGLAKGVAYVATVLQSGAELDWREAEMTRSRQRVVGQISACGRYFFDGEDWSLVKKPGGSTGGQREPGA